MKLGTLEVLWDLSLIKKYDKYWEFKNNYDENLIFNFN